MQDAISRRLPGGALRAAAAVVVLGLTLAAGIGLGSVLTTDRRSTGTVQSTPSSVDAGFARDMQVHHGQAVRMSVLVLARSEDEEVRTLATDILLTQQQQSGQMFGWLQQWGLPQASDGTSMAGMDDAVGESGDMEGMHSGSGSAPSMPGMASTQDLAALEAAQGAEADRRYLQLMIPHHQGGVEMARAAQDRAETAEATLLAGTIVRSQTAEIAALEAMLDARGGPLP